MKIIETNIKKLSDFNTLETIIILVIEECSEVIKECTKLHRRFGVSLPDSLNTPELLNLKQLQSELIDIDICKMQLLNKLPQLKDNYNTYLNDKVLKTMKKYNL